LRRILKHSEYQDEMILLFEQGLNYTQIAEHLIEKYNLDIQPTWFRTSVRYFIQNGLTDKEIIKENVSLAKSNQKLQDKNRIKNKAFREEARIENAIVEYNKELIKVLKQNSFKLSKKKYKSIKQNSALVIHLSDLHFNELVNIPNNRYDFNIASQRLYKFAQKIKEIIKLYKIEKVLIANTGDILNSDRRLDELLALSTNRSKATFLAVDILSKFIIDIYENTQVLEINFATTIGNESRITQDNGWIDIVASDNYDVTIHEILKILFRENPDIKFIGGNPLEKLIKIANQNILLIHGHQLGRANSNSIAKVVSKYAKRNIIIDFIIFGHMHECKISDYYARGSSLVGANAYSENALNLSSRASQNIYVLFKDKSRIDIRIDLQHTNSEQCYNIDSELAEYNAKSEQKLKVKSKIIEIVI
jgi:predicted phosphodiesterase|tara:strand:+ start:888 stop:2147 length:1260 start_codon:yes stop_codon:yes gene_type:complete